MASNDPTDTGGLFIGRRPGTAAVRYRRTTTAGDGRRRFDRVLSTVILGVELLLCLSLFGPQPAGWMWVGSQVQYLTGYVTAETTVRVGPGLWTLTGMVFLLS